MEYGEKFIIITAIFLFAILQFGLVQAEIDTTDPEYLKVLNEFDQGREWVSVIIGITSENGRDNVITSLSGDEFKLESKSLLGLSFSGEITENGLNKLINNTNVKWVNLAGSSSPIKNESLNKTEEIERETNYDWLLLLISIILIIIIIWIIFKIKRR